MAIVSMQLDPNAAAYTDDEIVAKVNSATANITRANCVTATARPIGTGEIVYTYLADGAIKTKLDGETDENKLISASLATSAGLTNAQIATGQAKANLDAMTDTGRGYLKTTPSTGEFRVISIQRDTAGKLDVSYDNEAV